MREIVVSDNEGRRRVIREDVTKIKEAASDLSAAVTNFLNCRALQLVSDPRVATELGWWKNQIRERQEALSGAFRGE
jgi:hypothetical protein